MVSHRRKRSQRCLWILLAVGIPFIYFQLTIPVHYLFRNRDINSACVIPHPDPYDPSVMRFVWEPKPLVCDTIPSLMFVDDSGVLRLNSSATIHYTGDISELKCEYRVCNRHIDDDHVIFSSPVPFTAPTNISADFISVACKNANGKVVYAQLLTNVALDSTESHKELQPETGDQLSVVLFGLDSVSRSSTIRKLPKTFRYLTETLGAYDLKGFMKVGENTLPNIVPLLTGRRVWTSEVSMQDYSTETFDSFPFIWRNFSDAGYATLLAEDMSDISTFNYLTKGFENPPTDHYLRPYYLGLSEMYKVHSKLGYVFRYLENRNINLQKSSYLCYGDKPHQVIHIEYIRKFMQRYKGKRRCVHSFLAELSHEYQNFLCYGDEDFQEFLKWMSEEGHLRNAVLIFFSDHGARIEEIRNTFVGRIEDRMPVAIIYIPDHIKKKHPEIDINLKLNTKRLTTFFDLYQTMVDILQRNFEFPTILSVDGKVRGISLLGLLPESRSCADAWIPEHYCACYSSVPISISTDPVLSKVLNSVIDELNHRLQSFSQCAQLKLHAIQEAYKIVHGLELFGTENTGISLFQYFKPESEQNRRYFLVFETVPGHALFEATYDLTGAWSGGLVGDLVMVNKYGHQSDCISEKRLRPLCFCS